MKRTVAVLGVALVVLFAGCLGGSGKNTKVTTKSVDNQIGSTEYPTLSTRDGTVLQPGTTVSMEFNGKTYNATVDNPIEPDEQVYLYVKQSGAEKLGMRTSPPSAAQFAPDGKVTVTVVASNFTESHTVTVN